MQFLKQLLEMSQQQLRDAEYVIEYLFKDLNLDVVWTIHFKERTTGRESDVTKEELIAAFNKLKRKFGSRLIQAKNHHQEFVGVLKDMASDLNIPFAIDFNKQKPQNNKYRLRGITIVRKNPNEFVTNVSGGEELRVEGVEDIVSVGSEDYIQLPKTGNSNKKKKKKAAPTTDKAENSLINTLWYYQNADAS